MAMWKKREKSDAPRSKTAQRLITVGVVAALVAVASAAALYIANKDSMTIRETVLVSMMGDNQEYFGKTRLHYQEESGQVSLENGGRTLLLNGAPVYKKESGGLVLSTKMTYTNYGTGAIRRVNHFAQVSEKEGVASIISGGRKEHQFNGGYLYDGDDTYLFLEPMTVAWGKETLKLAPLSYIAVFNKQGFYYYSAGDGKAAYISSGEAVVSAVSENGSYTLNMSNDIADLEDGRSFLLPPSPDSFDVLN